MSDTTQTGAMRALREERDALASQVDTLKLAITQAAPVEQHEQSSDATDAELIAALQMQVTSMKATCGELQQGMGMAEERAENLQRQVESNTAIWKRDERRLMGQVKAAEDSALQAQQQHQKAQSANNKDELQRSEQDSVATKAAEESAERVEELEDKLRSLTRKKTQAQAQLTNVQGQLKQAYERLDVADATTKELTAALAQEKTRAAELSAIATKLEASMADTISRTETAEANAEKLTQEFEFCKAALEKESTEHKLIKTRTTDMEKRLKKAEAEAEERQVEYKIAHKKSNQLIRDLRQQVSKQRSAFDALSREMETLQNKMIKKEQEFAEERKLREATESALANSQAAPPPVSSENASKSGMSTNHSSRPRPMFGKLASRMSEGLNTLKPANNQHNKAEREKGSRGGGIRSAVGDASVANGSNGKGAAVPDADGVKAALASRLESLLGENEEVKERVHILENCVQSLTNELEGHRQQEKLHKQQHTVGGEIGAKRMVERLQAGDGIDNDVRIVAIDADALEEAAVEDSIDHYDEENEVEL